MPVINGVYLKDFTALPGAVVDADIIPIAITGNQIAYRTTVAGIVTDARITAKLLTGLSVTGGAVVAADTILQAFGKVQNQINGKQGTITLTTTGTSGAATLISNTLNIPNYGSALTGYVPYTGATTDVDLGAFKLNAQSLHVKGTAGNGHLGLKHQSSSATAAASESSLFADSNGDMSFQNANLYLNKFVTSANSANRTYTFPDATGTVALVGGSGVGTVTSVAAITLGTTGTDLSSTVANGTTTPVITLQVPTASATNRGALSSADWSTFNGKAAALSGTINTIAYWNSATTIASLALATYPSLTELSYVKGVTSAIQTQLNAKQGTITLTTTGTSGAATFSSNTLNIPNYADGGVLSLSAIGGTANANGATITGTVLNLQPADASFGGVVTTGTQTIAGDKTLTGTLYISRSAPSVQLRASNSSVAGFVLANSAGTLHWTLETDVSAAGAQGEFRLKNQILNTNAINISTANLVTLTGGLVGTTANFTGQLTLGSTITNGTYTYTLPSATGTLALTSALTGYLPLTGGTLTGALSGTSATFTTASNDQLVINSTNSTGTKEQDIKFTNQSVNKALIRNVAGGNIFDFYSYEYGIYPLRIASTGAATFSGRINSTAAQNQQIINWTGTTGYGYIGLTNTTGFSLFGVEGNTSGQLQTGNGAYSTTLTTVGTTRLSLGTNQVERLGFDGTTGAATFSSTVTAPRGTFFAANGSTYAATPQIRVDGGGVNNNYAQIQFSDSALSDGKISYYAASAAADRLFSISARETETDFVIKGDGKVGLGTKTPGYQLQLSTDSAAKPSTNTWTIASDSRVKENITPYTKGLSAIMAINPINYDYNGKAGFSIIKGNIGLIAQDVLEILPESVSTYKTKLEESDEEDTELYNFNSHALTYILINAIKELKAEIDLLKGEPIIPTDNNLE